MKDKKEKFSINIYVDGFTDDYKAHIEKAFEEFFEETLSKMDLQYFEFKKDMVTKSKEFNFRPAP